MKQILLLSFLVGVFCPGCKKTYDCNSPSLDYKFLGFDSLERSVIIIQRYRPGSNLTELLGKTIGSSSIPSSAYKRNDTLAEDMLGFSYQGDEIITLPKAGNRRFVLRDLALGGETQSFEVLEEVKVECTQSWSIYLNDELLNNHNTSSNGSSYDRMGYTITLKK